MLFTSLVTLPLPLPPVSHALQQGLDLVEGLPVAAGHDGQRTGNGHGIAAADGRIQQGHAGVLDLLIQLPDNVGRGGAEVDDDIALLAVLHGGLHRLADDGVGGQDLHDDIAVRIDLDLLCHRRAAGGGELIQTIPRHIVAQNLTAALLQQVLRHGKSHNAQTQKTDLHVSHLLIIFQRVRPSPSARGPAPSAGARRVWNLRGKE